MLLAISINMACVALLLLVGKYVLRSTGVWRFFEPLSGPVYRFFSQIAIATTGVATIVHAISLMSHMTPATLMPH